MAAAQSGNVTTKAVLDAATTLCRPPQGARRRLRWCGDVTILRTASSIEELAVAAYQTAITSGLVKTQAIADAAALFQSQHKEHSAGFQAATKAAGGTPFAQPNPAVVAAIKPMVDALADDKGVVALAFELETAAAQSYQAYVGAFTDAKLNKAITAVGGVEAHYAAVLARVLNSLGDPPPGPSRPPSRSSKKAIAAGRGV
jgi:hypothetical protein